MNKNRTLDIKAAFSNKVHGILRDETLSANEKASAIDTADKETSDLLHSYWKDRKAKVKVTQLRLAKEALGLRKPKNKTTKEQWEAMKQSKQNAA